MERHGRLGMELRTERLRLRRFTDADRDLFAAFDASACTARNAHGRDLAHDPDLGR